MTMPLSVRLDDAVRAELEQAAKETGKALATLARVRSPIWLGSCDGRGSGRPAKRSLRTQHATPRRARRGALAERENDL
jgi:hypothetical protein